MATPPTVVKTEESKTGDMIVRRMTLDVHYLTERNRHLDQNSIRITVNWPYNTKRLGNAIKKALPDIDFSNYKCFVTDGERIDWNTPSTFPNVGLNHGDSIQVWPDDVWDVCFHSRDHAPRSFWVSKYEPFDDIFDTIARDWGTARVNMQFRFGQRILYPTDCVDNLYCRDIVHVDVDMPNRMGIFQCSKDAILAMLGDVDDDDEIDESKEIKMEKTKIEMDDETKE